jgi:hypothetical protein
VTEVLPRACARETENRHCEVFVPELCVVAACRAVDTSLLHYRMEINRMVLTKPAVVSSCGCDSKDRRCLCNFVTLHVVILSVDDRRVECAVRCVYKKFIEKLDLDSQQVPLHLDK